MLKRYLNWIIVAAVVIAILVLSQVCGLPIEFEVG